jgi:hypothetical protein
MLHRRVVENLRSEGLQGLPYQTYAFVGFHVLNECEIQLFKLLQNAGKALFYWDYDQFYLQNVRHEAGRFMRKNLEQFPNCLDKNLFDRFEKEPKDIRFVSTSTENAGARFLPEWIARLQSENGFKPEETAVVLCNEGLLLPVLHSVPDTIRELNVTMGFPLEQTPICNLVNELAALHADGFLPGTTPRYNHRWVLPILQHPLVRQWSSEAEPLEQILRTANSFRPKVDELQRDPLLTSIFAPARTPAELTSCLLHILTLLVPAESEEADAYDPLHAEALFRCHNLTSRLADLLADQLAGLSLQTFRKLLQQVLSGASIPFSGEPVRGLQIMGLLETRNLDFKNVLMLSVNEGMLPKGATDTSFIPYNLRKAFGLTTMEHKDSIFAYYFFRLLQRAEQITLVYNTATEGLNRGEMSRFMLQLLMESGHPVSRFNLTSGIELTTPRALTIEKTEAITAILQNRFLREESRPISPTALNSFLECSLRFYFHYVAGLRAPDEVSEDIDGAMLGNFFHHTAEYIYTSILLRKAGQPSDQTAVLDAIRKNTINQALESGRIRGMIEAVDLEPWLKGAHSIEAVVDLFFKLDFFKLDEQDSLPEFNGEQLVRRTIVTGFVKTMLGIDQKHAPFELVGLELEVTGNLPGPDDQPVRIGGTIDRLDRKEGVLRILDYKTGGVPKTPADLEALFSDEEDRASHIFQIFLYASILQSRYPDTEIRPELLYLHKAASSDFDPAITLGSFKNKQAITSFMSLKEPFQANLNTMIINLFDPNIPFTQTPHAKKCVYCDYKNLCRR